MMRNLVWLLTLQCLCHEDKKFSCLCPIINLPRKITQSCWTLVANPCLITTTSSSSSSCESAIGKWENHSFNHIVFFFKVFLPFRQCLFQNYNKGGFSLKMIWVLLLLVLTNFVEDCTVRVTRTQRQKRFFLDTLWIARNVWFQFQFEKEIKTQRM